MTHRKQLFIILTAFLFALSANAHNRSGQKSSKQRQQTRSKQTPPPISHAYNTKPTVQTALPARQMFISPPAPREGYNTTSKGNVHIVTPDYYVLGRKDPSKSQTVVGNQPKRTLHAKRK